MDFPSTSLKCSKTFPKLVISASFISVSLENWLPLLRLFVFLRGRFDSMHGSVLHSIQTISSAHHFSYLFGTRESFSEVKTDGTSSFQIALELEMPGSYCNSKIGLRIWCCLIKHQSKFTLTPRKILARWTFHLKNVHVHFLSKIIILSYLIQYCTTSAVTISSLNNQRNKT